MGLFENFPYTNFHEINLDQIIKIMRQMQDEWQQVENDWDSMQDFINNYFDNLDVSEEVLQALQTMAGDGELNTIIDPVIVAETASWLAEHITPTSPAVDNTLSIAGAAADAKATGDAVADLKEDFNNTLGFGDNLITEINSGYYGDGGQLIQNANFSHTNAIDVTNIDYIFITGSLHLYDTTQFTELGVFFDENESVVDTIANIIHGETAKPQPWYVKVPTNASTLIINTDYKIADYPNRIPTSLYAGEISASLFARWLDISDNKKIRILAGVIRNTGNGWEYINDTGHNPLNLTTVSVNNAGQIVIDYGFTATKVLSLVICPDETFASRYTAGSSVGLDNSIINVCTMPVVYGGLVTLSNNAFNIGYSSFTSASLDTTTGEIKLYHPSVASLLGKEKFNISAECNNAVYRAIIGSQGNDYVSLYLVNSSGNVLKDTTGLSISLAVTRQINSNFINANDVVSAGGNFWIMGVMEV